MASELLSPERSTTFDQFCARARRDRHTLRSPPCASKPKTTKKKIRCSSVGMSSVKRSLRFFEVSSEDEASEADNETTSFWLRQNDELSNDSGFGSEQSCKNTAAQKTLSNSNGRRSRMKAPRSMPQLDLNSTAFKHYRYRQISPVGSVSSDSDDLKSLPDTSDESAKKPTNSRTVKRQTKAQPKPRNNPPRKRVLPEAVVASPAAKAKKPRKSASNPSDTIESKQPTRGRPKRKSAELGSSEAQSPEKSQSSGSHSHDAHDPHEFGLHIEEKSKTEAMTENPLKTETELYNAEIMDCYQEVDLDSSENKSMDVDELLQQLGLSSFQISTWLA